MKIAILGSAPSSLPLAPFGDPSWLIWGCSPGVYPFASRVDAWFELHRWEPGIIGKPQTQKPWFSPEYVQWMAQLRCNVWMSEPVPQIPMSQRLPIEDLENKYGSYFWTSTIAYMLACAIEDILEARATRKADEPDTIGLWGVDMAATDEWAQQRPACQHFIVLAAQLGIAVYVPPESDLLRPSPRYGLDESEWWHIKLLARQRELTVRMEQAQQAMVQATNTYHFIRGALDDLDYMMKTWGGERQGIGLAPGLLAQSPAIRQAIADERPASVAPVSPPHLAIANE